MLLNKTDIETRQIDQITSLYRAAQCGDKDVVQILIAAKADVNDTKKAGITPTYIAAANGHKDVLQVLISAKADVNKININGTIPISIATQNSHNDILQTWIAAKADVHKSRTPVYIAAKLGHTEALRILIAAKAEVDKPQPYGVTPAKIVYTKGYMKMRHSKYNETTPLYIAAQNGRTQALQILIEAKADVDKCDLLGIVRLRKLVALELLLEARANPNIYNDVGETPLHIATETTKINWYSGDGMVRSLLAHKAKVNRFFTKREFSNFNSNRQQFCKPCSLPILFAKIAFYRFLAYPSAALLIAQLVEKSSELSDDRTAAHCARATVVAVGSGVVLCEHLHLDENMSLCDLRAFVLRQIGSPFGNVYSIDKSGNRMELSPSMIEITVGQLEVSEEITLEVMARGTTDHSYIRSLTHAYIQ